MKKRFLWKTFCTVFLLLSLIMMTACKKEGDATEYATEVASYVENTQEETELDIEINIETNTEINTEVSMEANTEESSEPDTEPVVEIIVSGDSIKDFGSVVILGNSAYELYTYREEVATDYAGAVNQLAEKLDGVAEVYNMVIPLSSGITFPDNRRTEISSSNQQEAMQKIQDKMSDDVHVVDIYDSLMEHRTEYIYFRADHHWTQLGAYYAYEDFCEEKGLTPGALDSYEKKTFDGFLGSFYKDTNQNSVLAQAPDVIEAYLPKSNTRMTVTATDGSSYQWPIINDVTSYSKSLKYSTFVAGDNPMTVIENLQLTDGSSCVIVKESFGNALIPFLVDHYQKIYVIDYRYWDGNLAEFAGQVQASDVIVMNNISMIRNKYLVGQFQSIVQ